MPADVKKLLAELKKGLEKIYGERLTRLYLYGSYARGDQREGSDLDVLVVLKDFERAPIELDRTSDLFCDLSLEYEITISLMFMRENDWLTADKPLLRNVRVEGVPVWKIQYDHFIEEEIKAAALASETVQKYLEGKEPKKVIVANKRLVNVVV